MDSDSGNSETDAKPKIEDVLLLNEMYPVNFKEKKRYYGKKSYKNAKKVANVEITDENLQKMIVNDLNGQYFPGYKKCFKSNYKDCLDKSMKNTQKSTEARIKANKLFAEDNHDVEIHKHIWELYCKSVAFAPVGSKELVLAYESRSNLLLHFKKYADCVKDIDRALNISNFALLQVKLLCRKMTCFLAMNKTVFEKIILIETLINHVAKVDAAFKDEKFKKMVDQAVNDSKSLPCNLETLGKCSCCSNSIFSIPCQNHTEMVFSKEIRIVADRDFTPGDMVIVTKPLVTSFNPNIFDAYCSHCLSFMWAGIPCNECSLCMYCSEECKIEAWDKYHVLECKILPHINIEHIDYNKMHLSTRVFLKGIKEFGSISKLKEKMQKVDNLRDSSKLEINLLDSDFVQFYASLHSRIDSCDITLIALSRLAMQACFLISYMIQTSDIFEQKKFKLIKGKELAREKDIVDAAFVMLKILISCKVNIGDADQVYTCASKCDKYSSDECIAKRHCCRGTYYDIFNAMFEKSCNPNVAKCWTDDGKIIYYCAQPIKRKEKITICQGGEFFSFKKDIRDRLGSFTTFCQCSACLKDWPTMEELFEKNKQRRSKIDSKETKIMEKYLERNQSNSKFVQEKFCNFNNEEYQQLLEDVNNIVKVCGQPSFASSLMIDYLCISFELSYGTIPIILHIPESC